MQLRSSWWINWFVDYSLPGNLHSFYSNRLSVWPGIAAILCACPRIWLSNSFILCVDPFVLPIITYSAWQQKFLVQITTVVRQSKHAANFWFKCSSKISGSDKSKTTFKSNHVLKAASKPKNPALCFFWCSLKIQVFLRNAPSNARVNRECLLMRYYWRNKAQTFIGVDILGLCEDLYNHSKWILCFQAARSQGVTRFFSKKEVQGKQPCWIVRGMTNLFLWSKHQREDHECTHSQALAQKKGTWKQRQLWACICTLSSLQMLPSVIILLHSVKSQLHVMFQWREFTRRVRLSACSFTGP